MSESIAFFISPLVFDGNNTGVEFTGVNRSVVVFITRFLDKAIVFGIDIVVKVD